jgi:hypothetical protein
MTHREIPTEWQEGHWFSLPWVMFSIIAGSAFVGLVLTAAVSYGAVCQPYYNHTCGTSLYGACCQPNMACVQGRCLYCATLHRPCATYVDCCPHLSLICNANTKTCEHL